MNTTIYTPTVIVESTLFRIIQVLDVYYPQECINGRWQYLYCQQQPLDVNEARNVHTEFRVWLDD